MNQFIALLIPFLCAKMINTYHHNYYNQLKEHRHKRFEAYPNCFASTQMLRIERDKDYDFMPRIAGTSIKISVGSPFFLFTMLAGVLLSVLNSLFKVNSIKIKNFVVH